MFRLQTNIWLDREFFLFIQMLRTAGDPDFNLNNQVAPLWRAGLTIHNCSQFTPAGDRLGFLPNPQDTVWLKASVMAHLFDGRDTWCYGKKGKGCCPG